LLAYRLLTPLPRCHRWAAAETEKQKENHVHEVGIEIHFLYTARYRTQFAHHRRYRHRFGGNTFCFVSSSVYIAWMSGCGVRAKDKPLCCSSSSQCCMPPWRVSSDLSCAEHSFPWHQSAAMAYISRQPGRCCNHHDLRSGSLHGWFSPPSVSERICQSSRRLGSCRCLQMLDSFRRSSKNSVCCVITAAKIAPLKKLV